MGKDSFGLLRSLMALLWGKQGLIRTLVGRVIFQHLGRGGRILDFKGSHGFWGNKGEINRRQQSMVGIVCIGGGGGFQVNFTMTQSKSS